MNNVNSYVMEDERGRPNGFGCEVTYSKEVRTLIVSNDSEKDVLFAIGSQGRNVIGFDEVMALSIPHDDVKQMRDWLSVQVPFTKQELVDLMGESAR